MKKEIERQKLKLRIKRWKETEKIGNWLYNSHKFMSGTSSLWNLMILEMMNS